MPDRSEAGYKAFLEWKATEGYATAAAPWLEDLLPLVAETTPAVVGELALLLTSGTDPPRRWAGSPAAVLREHALGVLGQIGSPAAAAADTIAACIDEHGQIAKAAARALGRLGPSARTAIASLIARLRSSPASPWGTRVAAATALGNLGPVTHEITAALIAYLETPRVEHGDSDVRKAAARALGQMGPSPSAAGALIACLGRPKEDWQVHEAAATALGEIGQAAGHEAVAALIAALGHVRLSVRKAAVKALGRMGPFAVRAVQPLVACLGGWEDDWKLQAYRHLDEVREAAPRSSYDIDDDEDDWNKDLDEFESIETYMMQAVRVAAAETLGEIGPAASEAAETLAAFVFFEPTEATRNLALDSYSEHDQDPILGLFEDFDKAERSHVVGLPRGTTVLEHSEIEEMRRTAIDALGAIGPEGFKRIDTPGPVADRAVEAFAAHLSDERWHVREQAADWLASLGPLAIAAVDGLLRSLAFDGESGPQNEARTAAMKTLGRIGPGAVQAVDALVQYLDVKHLKLATEAARALGQIGPPASGAVDALVDLIEEDREVEVENEASRGTVRHLREGRLFAAEPHWTRGAAIGALVEIGSPSFRVVEALLRRLGQPELDNKKEAAQAIGRLQLECGIRIIDGRPYHVMNLAKQLLG
jgi:HEAT repeat protein